MIKGQFLDDIREAAFAVLVLAVHVSGDAAADRQKRIAGQNRNRKALRQQKLEQLAKCGACFDRNSAPTGVEMQKPVKFRHVDRKNVATEPCAYQGKRAAVRNQFAAARQVEQIPVAVRPAPFAQSAIAPV